ncbi:hypothetical protein D3C85_627770 [compost metagenome]
MKSPLELVTEKISNVQFYRFPGTTKTACCVTYDGCLFEVGVSDCVDPGAYDQGRGRKAAYDRAVDAVMEKASVLKKNALNSEYMVVEGCTLATVVAEMERDGKIQ